MNRVIVAEMILCMAALALLAGCARKTEADTGAEAPPAAQVIQEQDAAGFKVEHPEQFPLVAAGEHKASPELSVTGTVGPDVSRSIPVISLASGRVLDVGARVGDTVSKGQLMLKVQSPDVAQAFSDYQQAVADEKLAAAQLERSQTLYEHGAAAQKDVELAQDAEAKAKTTMANTEQHLHLFGVTDLEHPDTVVNIYAPASGVVTDQQVTAAAGTQGLGSPNAFTISDLSHVWILCDVHESDLPFVRLGEYADVRLNAYPDRVFRGRVSNISPVLDPTMRTAKVRLELENPAGIMRIGMFVTATFHGEQQETRATVPAAAVLHLHDRDWVYEPAEDSRFRRVEVTAGKMLPGNLQEVSGIQPGQKVVASALVLQETAEQ